MEKQWAGAGSSATVLFLMLLAYSAPLKHHSESAQTFSAPQTIEIDAWPGQWFVLLEKPALYCSYGYELYTCPQLDACHDAVDTAVATKYHRVMCGKFAGHRLKALSIEQRGKEWLVTFEDSLAGKKFYAKTAEGVCHEVAFENDRDAALKRWQGRIVFSARGFITSFQNGKALTIKVRLQDSLRVSDVRFGLTPLPTKPLWLMVETSGGEKGTIPLYYSWTNVKKELRHDGNPWDDDLFENNPENIYKVDTAAWNIINEHHVRVGMTRDEIRLSWGRPYRKKTETYKGECWVYEKQCLYFDDKELTAIEEIRGNAK